MGGLICEAGEAILLTTVLGAKSQPLAYLLTYHVAINIQSAISFVIFKSFIPPGSGLEIHIFIIMPL